MMRVVRLIGVVVSAMIACSADPAAAQAAQVCADADNNGSVTVTDGVNMLRAAAGLSSPCTMQICDMTLDGQISVTDGVIGLRLAAQLPTQATCSSAEVANIAAMTQELLQTGVAVVPGASGAARANATEMCPDGGTLDVLNNEITFSDCSDGQFVLNGSLSLVQSNDFRVTFGQFTLTEVSTGDSLSVSGSVTVGSLPSGAPGAVVNGELDFSGTSVGSFGVTIDNVIVQDAVIVDGTLTVSVQDGIGSIQSIRIRYLGPVTLADVAFASGATASVFIDNSTDGRGVCTPCSSDQDCTTGLGCFPCATDGPKPCTGSTARCSVNVSDVVLECADGYF